MPSQINNSISPTISGRQPISLLTLLQIVTCCCIFFAVLRISPLAALIMTVIVAPALIRTAYISEVFQRSGSPLNWQQRLGKFAKAIGAVITTLLAGVLAFTIISAAFGLLGMLFGFAVASTDYLFEAGVIGTVGGMIWGMAGSFLTVVFLLFRFWSQPVT